MGPGSRPALPVECPTPGSLKVGIVNALTARIAAAIPLLHRFGQLVASLIFPGVVSGRVRPERARRHRGQGPRHDADLVPGRAQGAWDRGGFRIRSLGISVVQSAGRAHKRSLAREVAHGAIEEISSSISDRKASANETQGGDGHAQGNGR